ncbi:stage III sporulation protein AA [Alicyclobacillus sp.]|uniref:stage III sporulation protein AA n=1 Tax=Alicyclobacillus sp. TaxID=61169 RepID=UPI0025B7DCA6|nr:stage III sporulation protein AA [Alicyclobacillus sp.]MCL6516187.1 stage III sporulation protein AA [Alicyclobacillus sp.]
MTVWSRASAASEGPWAQVYRVCPPDVALRLQNLPAAVLERVEELRFRLHQPLHLCGAGVDQFLHRDHGLTTRADEALLATEEHLERVIQGVTQASLYAVEDEIRRGFVTMPGGHRVGIAGRAVLYESGAVRSFRSISAVNIRIAREHVGAAEPLRPLVQDPKVQSPLSVLILSPPQCGKTTLLRDLARMWSEGALAQGGPRKVAVVDERSEIAGCLEGVPQFRLGPRTDVLDACPKAEGMLMAIRSLSPDIVVTDEIGRRQDADAILEAANAGVAVLATAHARTLEQWRGRPHMEELYRARVFDRFVILSRRRGPGTVEAVLDASGLPVAGVAHLSRRTDAP